MRNPHCTRADETAAGAAADEEAKAKESAFKYIQHSGCLTGKPKDETGNRVPNRLLTGESLVEVNPMPAQSYFLHFPQANCTKRRGAFWNRCTRVLALGTESGRRQSRTFAAERC